MSLFQDLSICYSYAMHVIYVFGDSITYGAWDMGDSGWTAKFRKYLDSRNEGPTYFFYPLGIHGETTDGLVKRFDDEFEARRRHDDTTYTFIFAYGANDASWRINEQQFKTDIHAFESNFQEIITKAKTVSSEIYLLEVTPVNEEYSGNLVAKNKSCLNEYVDKYNEKLRTLADVNGVNLVAVNQALRSKDPRSVLVPDGLHPSALGHEIIFNKVKDATSSLLDRLES